MAVTWDGAAWLPSTAYLVRDRVVNGGSVYQCVVAGTSASSGGPSGTGSDPIVDGTVQWSYLGADGGITVLGVAAELDVANRAQQIAALVVADSIVGPVEWGDLFDVAYAMMAAHMATLFLRQGRGGAITSEAIGQMSASYATPATVKPTYAMSSYGVQFEALVKMMAVSVGAVP